MYFFSFLQDDLEFYSFMKFILNLLKIENLIFVNKINVSLTWGVKHLFSIHFNSVISVLDIFQVISQVLQTFTAVSLNRVLNFFLLVFVTILFFLCFSSVWFVSEFNVKMANVLPEAVIDWYSSVYQSLIQILKNLWWDFFFRTV